MQGVLRLGCHERGTQVIADAGVQYDFVTLRVH